MNDDMQPSTAPTGAIDWASESQFGAVVEHEGVLVEDRKVDHTAAGLRRLLAWFARRGAGTGTMPTSVRMCQTVEAPMLWPSPASSPWMRR